MRAYSDRRGTLRWAKSGPPRSGYPEQSRGSVASIAGATSPCCTPLLPTGLLWAITAMQPNVIRL